MVQAFLITPSDIKTRLLLNEQTGLFRRTPMAAPHIAVRHASQSYQLWKCDVFFSRAGSKGVILWDVFIHSIKP